MADVRVVYDHEGQTLTVWFSEDRREYVCEETGEEVVLMRTDDDIIVGATSQPPHRRESPGGYGAQDMSRHAVDAGGVSHPSVRSPGLVIVRRNRRTS